LVADLIGTVAEAIADCQRNISVLPDDLAAVAMDAAFAYLAQPEVMEQRAQAAALAGDVSYTELIRAADGAVDAS
jgi:hypothetical protein